MGPPGTRTPLSRERILATAVAMADEIGASELTLRRLAAQLHVHVTSIYNHVPSFDAVLDGMVEHVLLDAKLPTAPDLRWDAWVESFVDAMAEAARRHPGAFGVLLHRPVQGAEATLTYEAGMAAFRRAGLDAASAYDAVRTVALAATGAGAEQAARTAGQRTRSDVSDLPPELFPNLREVLPLAQAGRDESAVLSLVLVEGLRALMRTTKRATA